MKKIFLFSVAFLFLLGLVYAAETFTPIFCNDYEFTCCGGIEDLRNAPKEIGEDTYYQCSPTATRCQLQSFSISCSKVFVGSQNCHTEDPWYSKPYFTCDDERELSSGSKFNPEEYIWVEHELTVDCEGVAYIDSWEKDLGFCGSSGVANEEFRCGISVSGNDACIFQPNEETIYTSTSDLTGKKKVASHTVPVGGCVLAFQSGNRHICAYKEETCSSDSDCLGHTLGNKECIGRTLQTYGCVSYGTPVSEYDRGPFTSGWGDDKSKPISGNADFGKRCEIIKSESVQCCGDTDCGTDYFCDKNTFTCKEKVQCKKDHNCGVSIQCDWTTNTLKRPICNGGKCAFEEKEVGCCLDKNCDEGYFCNSEYECGKSSADRSSILSQNGSRITGAAVGLGNSKSMWIILIAILAAIAIGYFILTKRTKKITVPSERQCCEESKKAGKKFCTQCGKKLI